MIDWVKIYNTHDKKWLKSLITEGIKVDPRPEEGLHGGTVKSPAVSRYAATRLYELGEKDYAFEVLLDQMLQYKNPNVSKNTKYETCTEAMIVLGQLQDRRAIEHLIEALDEFTDIPALALSLINGTDLEGRLLNLTKSEGIRGFGAMLSLGFMKRKETLSKLIEILEHSAEYYQKYHGKIMLRLRDDIMYMLGNYDDETARRYFMENIQKSDIERYARNFETVERRLPYNKYADLSTLGWRIVKKYGLDKYLDTEEKRFVFSGYVVAQWGKVYKTPCPFKSDSEVNKIREEIIKNIWQEIKGDA